ncbi:hypothetical protein ACH5RR_011092 [Cinchona calisaya]|uniref:Uncharacterized protein n=1 Tax=Cinchona calisaya TaxID=153742 RepID=A0ABD3A6C0_9GENT
MATQPKNINSNSNSNIPVFSPTDSAESDEELQEELAFTNRRGCCFWFPCFGSGHSDTVWERISTTPAKEETSSWDWWDKGLNALKKIREWSELVAGPKWKTFIRRFKKSRGFKTAGAKFQYDPFSYSLNFDEGPGPNGLFIDDDDSLYRDFSSRYASIPVTANSFVGGGRNTTTFT